MTGTLNDVTKKQPAKESGEQQAAKELVRLARRTRSNRSTPASDGAFEREDISPPSRRRKRPLPRDPVPRPDWHPAGPDGGCDGSQALNAFAVTVGDRFPAAEKY
jgi:hypothetical protein